MDVFFDPVAGGAYLDAEVRSLAPRGTIWIYGFLGRSAGLDSAEALDLTPLIRKQAAIRGWALSELIEAGEEAWRLGCQHILDGLADGSYCQHIGGTFKLENVRQAHEVMEKGEHVGKLVLIP